MRRGSLLLALLAGLLLAGVGLAGPAAAHATLVSTDPGEGARLETAPDAVTLEFSEGVSLGAGYARVVTADGDRVDTGAADVDDGVLTIPLRSDLPDAGYLVSYRVVSADSHPISGTFSFVVGDGELVASGASAGEGDVDPVVGALLPAARWLGFGGLALAVGIPVLALACWPGGWASRRLRRLATAGTVAVGVSSAVGLLLQGPYAAGSGLSAIFDPALLSATASSGVGWAGFVRLLLVAELWALLLPAWRRGSGPSRGALVLAGALALGLVGSTAAVGHPVAGPWPVLAVLVTAVHVGAMVVWLGGLAGLLSGALRPETPADDVAAVLTRFSRLAFTSVVALVVSGIVQTVREVASPTALLTTAYGRLLMIKIAFVLVALTAAGVSRVWVQQRLGVRRSRPAGRSSLTAHAFAATADGPGDDGPADEAADARRRQQAEGVTEHLPSLRRSVSAELLVAVVVLALSAILVATPPARSAVAQPVDVTLPLQGGAGESGTVQISVDPARPGANTLHLYLFDDEGRLTQPAGIEVALTEPGQQLGPFDVDLEPAGPGHYVGDGTDIPGAGTWTLTVTVRVDEFTATTARTTFPVR
ncbi:copper resistance protein CopC [Blastococcus jejuensis]|uniref:Copper resistance protein CopC n=1 Tax=Blastococcus jejuensis TaxID=351224 RepID=A0ABP6PMZ3_9ACTN